MDANDGIIKGLISDGNHTFNELYDERTVLFATLCNQNAELAWKSKLHYDDTYFEGFFLCGLEIDDTVVTFHVEDKYWDYFKIPALRRGKEWDGKGWKEYREKLLSL